MYGEKAPIISYLCHNSQGLVQPRIRVVGRYSYQSDLALGPSYNHVDIEVLNLDTTNLMGNHRLI